jgi:hypothetical protein
MVSASEQRSAGDIIGRKPGSSGLNTPARIHGFAAFAA